MAKKSMTPSERREAILKVLCQRRQDKIDNLAFEFGVSVRTIKNDIEELSLAYPIETVRTSCMKNGRSEYLPFRMSAHAFRGTSALDLTSITFPRHR